MVVAAWVWEEGEKGGAHREREEGDAGERERRGIGKPLGCSFLIPMITLPLYL
jgi:hypothetical protein